MSPLWLLLAIAALEDDARILVTIESDLPGATARIDDISQDLALPVTMKLAAGPHEVVLLHASLPSLRSKLTIGQDAPHRYILSIEDPEHAPIVRLLRADKDDDVAIDGRFLPTPIPEANVVAAGAHEILMRRRGGSGEKRVRLVLERGQSAVFELNAAQLDVEPKPLVLAPIVPPPIKRSSPLSGVGWALIGAGAASALGGVYFATEAANDLDREREAEMSPNASHESIDPLQDAAERHALARNVAFGAALVSAGIGVVLLLVAD